MTDRELLQYALSEAQGDWERAARLLAMELAAQIKERQRLMQTGYFRPEPIVPTLPIKTTPTAL